MGVSKVTLNGVTLMDVTDKTVDTDNLLTGNTALRNDGETITGAVVTAPASDVSPNMDGTASAGVASTYSRGDHVHPSDTSRQVKITANGILKGDGSGNITSATAGTDYAAASHTQALSTITGAEDLQAIEALSGTSGLLKKTGANTWTLDTTTYIPSSQKGANSGVAELDSSGKVPTSQLPSYVDDVMEYSSISDFPATGETGKIYVDTTTNLVYRWGGSEYVEISGGLALGETSSTAYRGDRGKTAYDHATDASRLTTAQNSGLYKIATTSEGHVASVTAVEKADITGLGIPAQDTTYVFDGTYNASTNKAATVSTVTNAINALDGGTIGVGSTNKTITSLSQTDGNISATFDAINITKSQVSDFPTEMTPSSHVHGNITNDGDITTTATIAAGDRLVINDESESELTNSSITFAADKTKFLSNNGTWESIPVAEARKLGGIMVGSNLSMVDGVLNATDTTYVFDGTYDASTNKAATVSTITNAINALDGGTIGTGSTTKTITSLSQNNGNVSATFDNIAFPVTSVNTKTGDAVLSASDVGAQPTITVNGILKGNGSGTISKAVAGTDYQAPLPSQSGHSGDFLSTDGLSLYWKDTDTVKFYTIADDEGLKEYNAYEFYSTYIAHQLPVIIFGSEETFCYPETVSSTACYFKGISFVDSSENDMLVYQLFISSDTEDNYSEMVYIGGEELPPQSGNTGKFLQTSGTEASWQSIVFPVTSVNTKTGAVSLTASDVGALPDDTTIPQGTVTSVRVQATSPVQSSTSTEQSTTLNTTISLADGYGDTKNPYGTKTANYVLAGPISGTAAAPTFRALDASDIPSLTVSKISDFPSTMPPSSHTHGDITNGGDIITTSTIANGDRLVINDESASKVTNSSITFGTSETTFLTNKGTWATPSGTYSLPTASADTLGGIKVGTNLSISDGVLSATDTTYVFDGTYNASTNKAATVNTVTNAIDALDGGTIGTGSTTKTITALSQTNGNVNATFENIAFPVTSVNTKTGAVSLTANDVGALPDTTEIPTATSDLTNDSNFVSDASYVHTDNNFTTTLKDKLDGIAAGATVDDHKWNNVSLNKSLAYNDNAFVPYINSTTQTNAYLLDATSTPTSDAIARYSNTAFLSSTTPAANDSSTKVATTAFVSNAISSLGSVLDFKGTKETASQLPTTGNETGDVWIVTADSSEYVWDGTKWEKFGPTIDLSGYVPTSRTVNGKALSADISLTASDVGAATSSDISNAINALDGGTIGTGSTSKTITALSQSDGNVSATFNDIAIAWSQVTSGNDDLKAIENLSGTSGLLKKTAANTWSLDTTSYVPTSRKINTKALSGDITLTASDVGALPDDTEIPSATSDLTNDSGFITSADVPTASSTSPKMDGTATVGTEAKWAHGDHIHPTDTSRQAKITASGILKGNGSGTISAAVAGTDYQAPLPSQTGNNGKYLTTNGTVLSWGDVDALPSQTGQSGKYLTTNGTTASWSSVDALPSQTGQSGKYLTTNGTSASWSSISIPTATSDLTNDSGFITSADIPVTSVNNQTGDIVLTANDVGALSDSIVVPVINIVTNPALTASSGKFTWTISASSAGGNMNPNIILTVYEISTGMVVYPNIVVNQSTGNVTITINDTVGAGTLAASTYKAIIIA